MLTWTRAVEGEGAKKGFSLFHSRRRWVRVPDENQMRKCAHRSNVIVRIIKAHYNIVKTRPSNVDCGKINAIAISPLMRGQYKGVIIANL